MDKTTSSIDFDSAASVTLAVVSASPRAFSDEPACVASGRHRSLFKGPGLLFARVTCKQQFVTVVVLWTFTFVRRLRIGIDRGRFEIESRERSDHIDFFQTFLHTASEK